MFVFLTCQTGIHHNRSAETVWPDKRSEPEDGLAEDAQIWQEEAGQSGSYTGRSRNLQANLT